MMKTENEAKQTLILKVFETVLSHSNYKNNIVTLQYIFEVFTILLGEENKTKHELSIIQLISQSLTSLCQQESSIKIKIIKSDLTPLLLSYLNKSFQTVSTVSDIEKTVLYGCSKILESCLYKCEESIKNFHDNHYESMLFSMLNPKLPNKELFQIINKIYVAYCSLKSESIESDLKAIFDFMLQNKSKKVQYITLNIISSILSSNAHVRDIFRNIGGFKLLIDVLSQMIDEYKYEEKGEVLENEIFYENNSPMTNCSSKEISTSFNIIQGCMDVLTTAIASNISNKRHLVTVRYYKDISMIFEKIGIYKSIYFRYLIYVIECHIFGITCKENNADFIDLKVENAIGMELMFYMILSYQSDDAISQFKSVIETILHHNNYGNIESFSKWNVVSFIFLHFSDILTDKKHKLYPILYDIIVRLANYHLSPSDLFQLLRFIIKTTNQEITQLFFDLCQAPNKFPHFYLNHSINNRASIAVSKFPKGSSIPYPTGTTFSGWYNIISGENDDDSNICLVSFRSKTCESLMRLVLSKTRIVYIVNGQVLPIVTEILFNEWTHYVIVLETTDNPNIFNFNLYINANLIVSFQTPVINPILSQDCIIYIGNDSYIESELKTPVKHYNCRIGPCYLYNTKFTEGEIKKIYDAGAAATQSSKGIIRDAIVDSNIKDDNTFNTPYIFGMLPIQNCINQLVDISGNNCNISLQDYAVCISSTDICIPLQSIGGVNLLLPFELQVVQSTDYCEIIKALNEIIKKNDYYGNTNSFKNGNIITTFILLNVIKKPWFDDKALNDTFSFFLTYKGDSYTFKSEEVLRLFFFNTALLSDSSDNYVIKSIKLLNGSISPENSFNEENMDILLESCGIEACLHILISLPNINDDLREHLSNLLVKLCIEKKIRGSNYKTYTLPQLILTLLLSPEKSKKINDSNLIYIPVFYQENEKNVQFLLDSIIKIVKSYSKLDIYNLANTMNIKWFIALFCNCTKPATAMLGLYILIYFIQNNESVLENFINQNVIKVLLPYLKIFSAIPLTYSILQCLLFNIQIQSTEIYNEIKQYCGYVKLPVTDSVVMTGSKDENINLFTAIIELLCDYVTNNYQMKECYELIDEIIEYLEQFWLYNRTLQSLLYKEPYIHSIMKLYFIVLNCSNTDQSVSQINESLSIDSIINDTYFDTIEKSIKQVTLTDDNIKLDLSKCLKIDHFIETIINVSIKEDIKPRELVNNMYDECPKWSYPYILSNWYSVLSNHVYNSLYSLKDDCMNKSFELWCQLINEYVCRGVSGYFELSFDKYLFIIHTYFEYIDKEKSQTQESVLLIQCIQLLFYYFLTFSNEENDILSILKTGNNHINTLIPQNVEIDKKLLNRFIGPFITSLIGLFGNESINIRKSSMDLFGAVNIQNPILISQFLISLNLPDDIHNACEDWFSQITQYTDDFYEFYCTIKHVLISHSNRIYSYPDLLSGNKVNGHERAKSISLTMFLPIYEEDAMNIIIEAYKSMAEVYKDREWKYTSELRIGKNFYHKLIKSISNSKSIWGYDQLGHDIDDIGHTNRVVWKIDTRENKLRMRKRLKRNYKGNSVLSELDNNNQNLEVKKIDEPSFFDVGVKLLNFQFSHNSSDTLDISEIESSLNSSPPSLSPTSENIQIGSSLTFDDNLIADDDNIDENALLSDSVEEFNRSISSIGQIGTSSSQIGDLINSLLLPQDCPYKNIYNCSRVRWMDKIDGICLLCETALYFIPGYMNENGEIKEREFGDDLYKTHNSTANGNTYSIKTIRIQYDEIEIYYQRNYLLRPTAIEYFKTDGTTLFLSYNKEDSLSMYNFLCSTPKLTNCILNELRNSKNPKIELLKRYTREWRECRMSNFDYIMKLNTLAGRTYNDFTQYPVYPWIIADYTSEQLDLENPSTFRDLSKPMGAQDPVRAQHFLMKYKGLSEIKELGEPYHYGFHYSCAGYVLYYLVRLQPYSKIHVDLQGGHFDMPDRLFFSIEESFNSSAHVNPQVYFIIFNNRM